MGRFGSLMASTWRSNQSLIAWLVPQTIGPARTTPAESAANVQDKPNPDETTPHPKAHIGANQVIGCRISKAAETDGRDNEDTAGCDMTVN